jgi:hypothetical protein
MKQTDQIANQLYHFLGLYTDKNIIQTNSYISFFIITIIIIIILFV